MKMTVKTKLATILAATCLTLLLTGWSVSAYAGPTELLMGNPSQAKADTAQKDNFLMEKSHYTLSYNNGKGTPNWVSWHLSKKDLGNAPRKAFHPDESLPRGFTQITPKDYTDGGFDRGHMCPHSDRSADDDMSYETFLMSNMIPQSPDVNQKAWAQLEMYCRNLVENEHDTLYIVDGPAGQGGTGRNGFKQAVGNTHQVVVPAKCWKVIMVLGEGPGSDLNKVNEHTRIIAVIMPNDMTVGEGWAGFRVPVKDVEALTGYKFFDKVPAAIIGPLKERVDDVAIAKVKPIVHGGGE